MEIAWAQKVVAAYHTAVGAGMGTVNLENTMIDAASVRMAEATLSLAERARLL